MQQDILKCHCVLPSRIVTMRVSFLFSILAGMAWGQSQDDYLAAISAMLLTAKEAGKNLTNSTLPSQSSNNGDEEDFEIIYTTTVVPCTLTSEITKPTVAVAQLNLEDVQRKIEEDRKILQRIEETQSVSKQVQSELQHIVNQSNVINSNISNVTNATMTNVTNTTVSEERRYQSTFIQNIVNKVLHNELQMRDISETKQILNEAIHTILTSETFKSVVQRESSHFKQWLEEHKEIKSFIEQQNSYQEFIKSLKKTVESFSQTMKESWKRVLENQRLREEHRRLEVVQEQTIQEQQQQQQVVQQQTNVTTKSETTCLESMIKTLSTTQRGSMCKAIKVRENMHYEVHDVIQTLLRPRREKMSTPLESQITVQNVFNKMYQSICFREHYAQYQKELAEWYRDEGWIKRPPPIPPSKMCPPKKLFDFSKSSPPWLNRLPAWIRAKYYADSSIYEGQVHFAGSRLTCSRLWRLRKMGKITGLEYAYYSSLYRASKRMMLTGTDPKAILAALVAVLGLYNPPTTNKSAPQVLSPAGRIPRFLNELRPRSERFNSTAFVDAFLPPYHYYV